VAHQHAGRTCEHSTKKACDAARREVLGRCVELIASDKSGSTSCRNWAVDRVNGKAVCGQHYLSIWTRDREAAERARQRAVLDASIDSFIASEPRRIAKVQTWSVVRELQALTP
jgi:hypothetical protein